MSLIHPKSVPCAIDQLELFSPLSTCAQIERSTSVPHYSISSIADDANIIEFQIQGSGDQYIDLARTKLYLKIKVTDNANAALAAGVKVAPLDNTIASLFSQCDIFLNNKLVTSSNNMYTHRAYIEQVLTYSADTAHNQLSAQLFYRDSEGHFDSDNVNNKGFTSRNTHVALSKWCDISGPLFTDIVSQPRYLINNVDMRVRLVRNSNEFCLMYFDNNNYKVHIEEAVLYVQKVNINPSVQLALEAMLRKQNALYNIHRTELKSFTIPGGSITFTREHISLGVCPKYAIIGLVDTAAMQGDPKLNPLNFQHFNLKQISLNVDGERIPLNGINCNYGENLFMEGYQSLIDVIGKYKNDNSFMVKRSEYNQGTALYGFQLVPELVQGAFNLKRNTNVRLDITFANSLTKNVTVIVWFSYDSVLEISNARDIFYDFSA